MKQTKLQILVFAFVIFLKSYLALCEQSKPNTYFYPKGANEYFVSLLQEFNIPYEIEYDKDKKIKLISWDNINNRAALEQALKVHKKLGSTKNPESIKMLSPEMNDRFEELLNENKIPYIRKGDFTYYDWEYWVDVEILKSYFYKKELKQ